MKSILKLFPVALGVLTLASCSNDDFFGSGAQNNGQELVPTVEKLVNADGETTRSAWTAGGKYQVSWQTGDVFRAYDNAVQAYDIYSKKEGAGITIDGAADVDAHKYAIFPGNQVSYAGWDKANGLSAVMKIDNNWNYKGESKATFSAGEVPVYHSDLPMWGPIANETSEDLQVALSYLTSVLDVCIYQQEATNVRVVAFADGTAVVPQLTTATAFLGNLANAPGAETPLSGYFFAQLKDGGQLVADMTQPAAMIKEYGYALEVALPTDFSNEAHVLIPVVPATYKYLSVQYSADGGTSWKELKGYADTEFKRAQVRKSGLEIGDAPITAHAESLKDLNNKLAVIAANSDYAGKIVNIFVDGKIQTGEGENDGTELIIPDMGINNKDLFVNIIAGKGDGIIHNTYTNNSLTIRDASGVGAAHASHTATINFVGGLIGTESIIINTTAFLRLGGSISSDNNKDGYKHKTIDVRNVNSTPTSGLTLGIGAEGDLNTDMNVKLTHTSATVVVDANEGTIPAIDAAAATNVNNITVMSGKVTAIGANTAAVTPVIIDGGEVGNVITIAADVTVNDGIVNKIVTNGTGSGAGDVMIYGGTVADVSSAKGNVTITALGTTPTIVDNVTTDNAQAIIDAPITSLTSAATGTTNTITVNANITNLKLSGLAPEIILTGTTIADDDAVVISNIETTDAKKTQTVKLTSTDKAAVGNVTFAKSDDDINAASSFTVTDAKDVKTSEIGDDKVIYTAAQLAGIGAGNYKLNTDVDLNGATWTPLDLSGDFKLVKAHEIKDLNAPLFNKVTGTSTIGDKTLTIKGFTYGPADEDNLGIIAKEVDGATVTIKNVILTGSGNTLTGDATSENVGAAIGKANVSTKLVLEGLNFANLTLTGHANVGGFIGNVVGGNVEIKKGTAAASTIDLALDGTYDTSDDDLAGTFGNIIGSVTGIAKITIGAKGNSITTFNKIAIDNSNYQSTYKYNSNVNAEDGKFTGMYGTSTYTKQPMNYEIGYSPATSIKVTMYGKTKDDLGNDVNITEKDINQFND